jgi:hypothetical protein
MPYTPCKQLIVKSTNCESKVKMHGAEGCLAQDASASLFRYRPINGGILRDFGDVKKMRIYLV